MKTRYDAKVDALYIEFHPLIPGTAENRTLNEDVTADYGPDGRLSGLEILDAAVVLGKNPQKLVLRANLSGADLSRSNLSGADLSGADLGGANLSEADLSRSDLSGADLSGADLGGANLSGADLSEANLRGATFSKANLKGANLTGALNFKEVRSFGKACLLHIKGLTEEQLAYAKSEKGAIID